MERIDTQGKCARCGVTPHPFIGEDAGAVSRASMSGEPTIVVCSTCRERETFRGSAGLPLIPFTAWPVPLEALIAEDRLRLAYLREKPVTEMLRARRRRDRLNQSG